MSMTQKRLEELLALYSSQHLQMPKGYFRELAEQHKRAMELLEHQGIYHEAANCFACAQKRELLNEWRAE